ncbi:MAG: thioredoxin fold domain-containing protein [Gammaproteobacteria bacterium]|nr:thioredoxin fold domain-containing protein [Gammaproteobacteria bacterium]
MRKPVILFFLITCLLGTTTLFAAQGRISGERAYTIPDWFKLSLMELQDDVEEARESNKHLMLFMHIDRCPYCTRMLEENFRQGKTKTFIQSNFDVIALNIRGDREVFWDNETSYTEKTLSRALGVHATPTIVFLNQQGQKVFQMNGYRKPSAFKHVLNYVNDQQYTKITFLDYVRLQAKTSYTLKSHPLFSSTTDLSNVKGPLAVIFEDQTCTGCNEFHQEVLHHKDVLQELKPFTLIRLDAFSNMPITDINGKQTTPKAWAKSLELDYRPGTILFDQGKEIARADGRLYHFHFKELLRYVSMKHYQQYPTYIEYLGPRQIELLNSGVDIDFGR